MRPSVLILAVILACGAPPSVLEADPSGAGPGARPSLRGNRLIASSSEGVTQQIEVTVTSPVAPGDTATATVRVPAGSRCTIAVAYRSGPSEAQGLDPVTAGEDGTASWSWIVGINTTPGDWAVQVDCNDLEGSHATGRGLLTVEEADPAAPSGSAEGGR